MKMLRVLFALSLSVSVWAFSASRLAKVQTLSPIVRSMAPTATHYQAKTSRETFRLSAATSSTAVTPASKGSLKETLKVGSFFGLWYALNIGYNIYNKKVLNLVPELVWSVALLQLFVGLFYVLPVWALGIRKAPELSVEEVKGLLPVAVTHLLTHVGAIISLGAGAVSFTHVVKAAEPAVSAAMSAVFLKSFLPWQVSLTLLPVIGGVAMASLTELSFSWLSFISAMVSNVASAARGIVGKKTMNVGKNMNASNLYAIMTILSTLMLLPVSLALDWKNLGPVIGRVAGAGRLGELVTQTLLSCLFYYAYNEVAFLTLDKVAPVTHALGNTIKRVVIILTSVIVFGTKMSTQGAIGSGIAIFGVLLYSLAKNNFK